jgi:transposase-like protein
MARSSRHPREVRERAVALVLETQSDYGCQWEAIESPHSGGRRGLGRVQRIVAEGVETGNPFG